MRRLIAPNFPYCHPAPSLFLPSILFHQKNARPNKTRSLPLVPWLNRQLGFSPVALVAAATSSLNMADSTGTAESSKTFSVLFVCLGNICRSPAAEAVFSSIVQKRGLDSKFRIDSAGTIDYHEGNPADSRMRAAANKRGINVTSISRPVRPSDFRDFDLILAMDMQNRDDLLSYLERWSHKENFPEDVNKKVKLMCSFCKKHSETEVPDPYYGGPRGFEKVMLRRMVGWGDVEAVRGDGSWKLICIAR